MLGKPTVISTDNEVNKYILQHEGTLVELWYLDSFAKFFALEGENRVSAIGEVHRYTRSITLNHFGIESLRESLLPKIENMINTNLAKWATQGPVDMKQAIAVVSTFQLIDTVVLINNFLVLILTFPFWL